MQGALAEGYLVNVTVADSTVDVVCHNIEVERTTLGEIINGVVLAGDTSDDTIGCVADDRLRRRSQKPS